jgi:serine/threonine protein phosphatase PrpC
VALILRYAVRSDLGLVRGNNEDSVYAGPRLLAIADGMGGHAAGEVASKIVIGTMEPLDDDRPPGDLIAALRDTVIEANHRIADAVEQDKNLDGMGTTLTALRFAGSQVALVHVGDSRAYLLRGDTLSQITHDDTYVQYLVDSGKLTEEEAKDHPRKSVILRALRGAEVEPDVSIREARAGDRYLLCSDGLSDVVSTETILETLRIPDAQESADRLVELALRSGGPDNVTVIVADVVNARPGEIIDDVPVMDGAFVDPSAADVPGDDTPAGRAAELSRPRPASEAKSVPAPRRGRWKAPAILVGILVVLIGALGGTYAWAQTQYYVGRAGDEVVIYRGVDAAFGPIKFSEVWTNTDLKVEDLNPAWRSQVQSGITAKNRSDARRIITRLHSEQIPNCATRTVLPPTSSAGASTTGASTTGASTAGTATTSAGRTSAAKTGTVKTSAAKTSPTRAGAAKSTARRTTASNPQGRTSAKPSTSRTRAQPTGSTPAPTPTPTPSPSVSVQASTPADPCRSTG